MKTNTKMKTTNQTNNREGVQEVAEDKHKGRVWSHARLLIPAGIVFVVLILLFRIVFMVAVVPTGSMEPTLKAGSVVLALRLHGMPSTGDIVIFKHDGDLLIKRIAATAGDEIIRNGKAEIVPEDSWYMLGDNTNNSYDSRYWDNPYIKTKDIVATLLLPNGV